MWVVKIYQNGKCIWSFEAKNELQARSGFDNKKKEIVNHNYGVNAKIELLNNGRVIDSFAM